MNSDNGGNTQRRVFLRSCSCGGFRRAGSNGILPLPIMQILVGWPGQCFHPLEARRRAGHCGCGTCCHVPKDKSQPAAILQEVRWPSYDQSSSARIGGRICSDVTDIEVQRGSPRQLCRNSFADAGRTPQAEGFSQRAWRLRRSRAGIRRAAKAWGQHTTVVPDDIAVAERHATPFASVRSGNDRGNNRLRHWAANPGCPRIRRAAR